MALRRACTVAAGAAATAGGGGCRKAGRKVLMIAGPTAVGKSAVAMAIAKKHGGEIISADSVQVYQELDKGTSKPTADERAAVPHHLIDVVNIDSQYTVGDFVTGAEQAIEEVLDRGGLPIVVGGTSFYMQSLIDGLPGTPETDPYLALELESQLRPMGWDAALNVLAEVDPKYAASLSPNDWRRLERALNIIKTSGRPVSDFGPGSSSERAKRHHEWDFRCIFLTAPRLPLYTRIDSRCEQMVANGLVEEVARLVSEGFGDSSPGANALGYRQAISYLQEEWLTTRTRSRQRHRRQLLRFIEKMQSATRRFARKQIGWVRTHQQRHVCLEQPIDEFGELSCDGIDEMADTIVERFEASDWALPSDAEMLAWANADRAAVVKANMRRYAAVNLIYDDNDVIDETVDRIRNELESCELLGELAGV